VNVLKPLLDIYIGPFKDMFSYWTGFLLLVRVTVLGLSALNEDASF